MTKGFDEIRTRAGKIREPYKKFYPYWDALPLAKKALLRERSKKFFNGDYSMDPMPRILRKKEFDFLKKGVEQRARALLAFLQSYHAGEKSWNQIVPEKLVDLISRRHHFSESNGRLNPDNIAFSYGPDIIRSRSGKWLVIEDNIGNIGGIGDILSSQKAISQLLPEAKESLACVNNPERYFAELIEHFRAKAHRKGGIPVLVLRPYKMEADNETKRVAQIFSSRGIDVVTPQSRNKKIIFSRRGVFLKREGAQRAKRVGYVVMLSSPESFDYHVNKSSLRIEVKKNLNLSDRMCDRVDRIESLISGLFHYNPYKPCLMKAVFDEHIYTNYSPGVDFVTDKSFTIYVSELIRFYLGERPLLDLAASSTFVRLNKKGNWLLKKAALRKVFEDKEKYVIKESMVDGGSGVWIGADHASRELRSGLNDSRAGRKARVKANLEFESLKEKIQESPESYIFQKHHDLSFVEDKIVDLRIHTHVDVDKIVICDTPWGRARSFSSGSKVNISSGGMVSAVLVVE